MTAEPGWLLLIHQIPQNPGYLRVKVWRRLQRVGAVAIKSSVYVLPVSEQAREDFEWTLREIVQGGGDASICEARFVEGLSVEQVEALFHAARDADYAQIAEEAREVGAATEMPSAAELARLRRRLEEVSTIDFFGAPGRALAEAALLSAEARVRSASQSDPPDGRETDYRCRTWVTRKGIHVDRMASAWLIRKFIDPEARFKFVAGQGYMPEPQELRFDMFQAEFTHEGDDCTFEVLKRRFALEDAALDAIAEIVHDIDLKDGKFGSPEAQGVAAVVAGICRVHRSDDERLTRGEQLFDHLQAWFGKNDIKRPGEAPPPARGGTT
jgi:hypothetical protein